MTLVKYVDTTRVHGARLSRQICMYRISVRRSTTLLPLPTQRHSAQPWPAGSTCTHTSQSHSQVLSMETAWTPSVEGPDSGMHMLCKTGTSSPAHSNLGRRGPIVPSPRSRFRCPSIRSFYSGILEFGARCSTLESQVSSLGHEPPRAGRFYATRTVCGPVGMRV